MPISPRLVRTIDPRGKNVIAPTKAFTRAVLSLSPARRASIRQACSGSVGLPIRPGSRDCFVDVGDRHDLAHRVGDGVAEVGVSGALHTAMVLEGDDRRQRTKPLGLHEDFGAEGRVRLDQLPFPFVEGAWLLHDLERNPCLPDVVQEGSFHERGSRRRVESDLFADQQAQHRDVHGVAVRQVLVLFDGENLPKRRIAARNLEDEQLDEIAHRDWIETSSRTHRLEGLLRRAGAIPRRLDRADRSARRATVGPANVCRAAPAARG